MIYTLPIQATRPSLTLSYNDVFITLYSFVYLGVIGRIHRLASGHDRTLHQIICHLWINDHEIFRCVTVSLINCIISVDVFFQSGHRIL